MPIDSIKLEKMSQKALERKNNKPIMEKKRRARINQCLNQLKAFILEVEGERSRHAKLEKADILELTVKYVETMKTYQIQMQQISPIHQHQQQQSQLLHFHRQAAAAAAAAAAALSNARASILGSESPSIDCSSDSPTPSSSASSPSTPSSLHSHSNHSQQQNVQAALDLHMSPVQQAARQDLSSSMSKQQQLQQHLNQLNFSLAASADLQQQQQHQHQTQYLHSQQHILKQRALSQSGQISPTWRPW